MVLILNKETQTMVPLNCFAIGTHELNTFFLNITVSLLFAIYNYTVHIAIVNEYFYVMLIVP